ncbi:MAG: antibiotic biosynthesis monooxygenase [Xanthobacteraceae bacterium]
MILETAILSIKPGQSAAFEAAMTQARPLIAATAGFQRIEVRPCMETGDRYLLLVWWDSLEAHTHGFRGSERYQAWRNLLHDFYDPFPLVEHYAEPI